MKKMLFVFMSFFILPVMASASVKGAIFGATDEGLTNTTLDGNSVSVVNQGTDTKIYLGLEIIEGSYSRYEATLKLSDSSFRYRSHVLADGWSGTILEDSNNPGAYLISLESNEVLTVGRYLVVTVYLDGVDSISDTCTITLSTTKVELPVCKYENGNYYDMDGNVVSYPEYLESCTSEKYSCEVKNGYYFDRNGNSVSESEYLKSCFSCRVDGDKYYDIDGKLVDKETYENSCGIVTNSCVEKDGNYYDEDGNEVSEETYHHVCFVKSESYKCLSETEIEHIYTMTHIINGNTTYSTEVLKYGNSLFDEVLNSYPNVLDECKSTSVVPTTPEDDHDDFENPETGMDTSYYMIIPIGFAVGVYLYWKSRKHYFYKL